uniref:taste receptor type 2 member 9-like n=1 Tax=Euleptes europaea TaxID=460621 RepID=UPI00254264A3|nr:taste receptor type 2 member 9-like [Euleptes europaea]
METLIGMGANGFIVLINVIDWLRSRKLSMTDLILTSLGLARLAWQAVAILFVAFILQTEESFAYNELHWTATVFENMNAAYPAGHAIILILINPKLKKAWFRMLQHFKCHLSEASS